MPGRPGRHAHQEGGGAAWSARHGQGSLRFRRFADGCLKGDLHSGGQGRAAMFLFHLSGGPPTNISSTTEEVSLESWMQDTGAGPRGWGPGGAGGWGCFPPPLPAPEFRGSSRRRRHLIAGRGVGGGARLLYHGVPEPPPGPSSSHLLRLPGPLLDRPTGGTSPRVQAWPDGGHEPAGPGWELRRRLARFAGSTWGSPAPVPWDCGLMMGLPAAPWTMHCLPSPMLPGSSWGPPGGRPPG